MATLHFQGNSIHTAGDLPKVGDLAPDFTLLNNRLQELKLSDFSGNNKLLSILPSLDTPVCAAQARKFNLKAAQFQDTWVLLISKDLPFAQSRFCQTEGVRDVKALSAFRSDFAEDYGVLLVDSILKGLTARAVIVIDKNDKICYTELVDELTDEPDYETALDALRQLSKD